MKLFVYGTLKKNHYNHKRFHLDTQEMIEDDDKVNNLSLVMTNEFYPTAIVDKGGHIVGEVWEISDEVMLKRLRAMEAGAGYKEMLTTTNKGHEVLLFVGIEDYSSLPRTHHFPLNEGHTW